MDRPLRLFLLTQNQHRDYDTFDSAIVAAYTEEEARCIHPGGDMYEQPRPGGKVDRYASWPGDANFIEATCVGTAEDYVEAGMVLVASFNAG